jgi:hypothetical protein
VDPTVGQNHEETAHDGKITEEEVEIEDEAVAEGLRDDHTNEAYYSVFRVFSDYDHGRAYAHRDNVGEEKKMSYAAGDCNNQSAHA